MRNSASRILNIIEKIIDSYGYILFLILFLVGTYAIFDVKKIENEAEVDKETIALTPSNDEDSADKISELQNINPEIIGWLTIDNTNIDYPVLQTTDNSKYLTRNHRGENSTAGSIFVDYRNNISENNYNIIYGHRMASNQMFSDIARFTDQGYFDSHPSGTLYLKDKKYDLEIIAFAKINIANTKLFSLDSQKNSDYDTIIEYINKSGENIIIKDTNKHGKLFLLSTCNKDSKHYRDVILAKAKE